MVRTTRFVSTLALALTIAPPVWSPRPDAIAAVPTWDPIHLLRIVVRSTAREVHLRVAEPSALIEARGSARPRAAHVDFEGFNRSADLPDFGRQPLIVQRRGAHRVQARFLAAVTPGDAPGVRFIAKLRGRGEASIVVQEVNRRPFRMLARHRQDLPKGSFAIDGHVMGARGVAPGTEPLPPKVLAFYYQWYRMSDWGGEKPTAPYNQNPLPYNSGDLLTIEKHLLQAQRAGLDGFIVSWLGMGTPEERNLELLVSRLPPGFEFALYLETFYPAFQSEQAIVDQLAHALDKYGSHPNYLRIDGRPVVYGFSTLHVLRQIGTGWNPEYLEVWDRVLERLRDRGHRPFLVGEGRPFETKAYDVFEGMHSYGTRGPEFTEWLNQSMSLVARAWGAVHGGSRRLYGASILPGYDDRHLPGRTEHTFFPRENGALYRQQWDSATRAGSDQALVVSFNEWPETTNIEPNLESGDLYLDLTAQLATVFRASRA